MLKNRASKRTRTLLPVLKSSTRVLLLSGTPALARPLELYPQLEALDIVKSLWHSEDEFLRKYGRVGVELNSESGSDDAAVLKNGNLAESVLVNLSLFVTGHVFSFSFLLIYFPLPINRL